MVSASLRDMSFSRKGELSLYLRLDGSYGISTVGQVLEDDDLVPTCCRFLGTLSI